MGVFTCSLFLIIGPRRPLNNCWKIARPPWFRFGSLLRALSRHGGAGPRSRSASRSPRRGTGRRNGTRGSPEADPSGSGEGRLSPKAGFNPRAGHPPALPGVPRLLPAPDRDKTQSPATERLCRVMPGQPPAMSDPALSSGSRYAPPAEVWAHGESRGRLLPAGTF